MRKIARLIDHIQEGTLLNRIHGELRERARRRRVSRWKSQSRIGGYFEVEVERGVQMRLHLDSELARLIYCDDFEIGERHFVSAFLRPGDIFVDVGANIGLFSLIAANRVANTGTVYAFEPAAKTFNRLCDNIKLNNLRNVQPFQLALSDETGEFPFYTSDDGFDAWNSIARPIAGRSFTREFIQCVTWAQFARLHQLAGRVTMMKIDVEGWESRVLEGGREFFSGEDAPLLQVEFTEEASASAGFSCKYLYGALEDFGYRMFTYESTRRELVHDPLRKSYPYINLIATKRPEEINRRLRKNTFW